MLHMKWKNLSSFSFNIVAFQQNIKDTENYIPCTLRGSFIAEKQVTVVRACLGIKSIHTFQVKRGHKCGSNPRVVKLPCNVLLTCILSECVLSITSYKLTQRAREIVYACYTGGILATSWVAQVIPDTQGPGRTASWGLTPP